MLKKIAAYFSTTLLLLLIGIESNAATACFTPSALKGCAPFTVTLNASCAVYDPLVATPQYNYDFLNNPAAANFVTATTKTYLVPGTYRILQFIDGSPTGRTFIDIVVTASPDPVLQYNHAQAEMLY